MCVNGSNFVVGLSNSNIPNIPCLTHTYQLVIHDGSLAQTSVTSLTAKARKLVLNYRQSNLALHRIQKQLNCPVHKFIQEEPTCWNTTYYMLDRLLEQRQANTATNVELDVPVELRSTDRVLAEKVVKILFEEATREASGSNATSTIIISVVNSILRYLESDVSEDDVGLTRMKQEMLRSLNSHYSDVDS